MRLGFLLFLLGVGSAASDATEPVPSRPYFSGRLEQDTTQTPILGNSLNSRAITRRGATLDSLGESRGNMSTGKRVALKLIAGTLGGVMGAVIGASSGDGGQEINFGPALYGYLAGIAIGVPVVEVSGVDPRDRSILSLIASIGVSLGGSVVGVIGGGGLTLASQDALWPSILVGPVVGATLASERWSKSSAARRFSLGLAPNPRGSWSAIVTLYF